MTLTPFHGHLKKVHLLLGVSFFARSLITRAKLQSGHSIKGSSNSLHVAYATSFVPMELPPRSCLLTDLLPLEDFALCDTVVQGRGEGSWRWRRLGWGGEEASRKKEEEECGGEGMEGERDRVRGGGSGPARSNGGSTL